MQALLELLSVGGLMEFDEAYVLRLATNARFYRVCELIYRRQRKYAEVFQCYIKAC